LSGASRGGPIGAGFSRPSPWDDFFRIKKGLTNAPTALVGGRAKRYFLPFLDRGAFMEESDRSTGEDRSGNNPNINNL
jgi:hypothetical protein